MGDTITFFTDLILKLTIRTSLAPVVAGIWFISRRAHITYTTSRLARYPERSYRAFSTSDHILCLRPGFYECKFVPGAYGKRRFSVVDSFERVGVSSLAVLRCTIIICLHPTYPSIVSTFPLTPSRPTPGESTTRRSMTTYTICAVKKIAQIFTLYNCFILQPPARRHPHLSSSGEEVVTSAGGDVPHARIRTLESPPVYIHIPF